MPKILVSDEDLKNMIKLLPNGITVDLEDLYEIYGIRSNKTMEDS